MTFELDSDYSTDISVDGQEEMPLLKGDLVRIERSSLVTNLVRLKQVSRLEKIKTSGSSADEAKFTVSC